MANTHSTTDWRAGLARYEYLRGPVAYLLYFALLIAVALPQGLATSLAFMSGPISPLSDADALIAAFGMSDAGTYVLGGKEIVETGWLRSYGTVPLWPPGMFAFSAFAQWLAGPKGPVALVIILLVLAVWAGVLTLLFLLASRQLKPIIAALLPLALLAFPFMHTYMLSGGLFYTEPLATALWMVGLLLLMFGGASRPVLFGLLAGVALAAAAYVRNQLEIVVVVTTLVVAAAFLMRVLLLHPKVARVTPALDRLRGQLAGTGVGRQLLVLLVAFSAFHALTIPYRAYNYAMYGTFSWALGYGYYYRYVWMPPEDYPPIAGFVLLGGGPIGCAVDKVTCEQLRDRRRASGEASIPEPLYEQLTRQAMLKHPFSWVGYRLAHLPPYWFSGPGLATPVGRDYASGGILLVLGLGVFALLVLVPLNQGGVILATMWLGLALATSAVFMFLHYEVRYLYQFQAAIIVFSLIGLVQLAQSVREAEAAGAGQRRLARWLRPISVA